MKFAFYSTMQSIPWGGSEELWSRAALVLQERGHTVVFNYKWWPKCPDRLAEIQRRGSRAFWREKPRVKRTRLQRLWDRALRKQWVHDFSQQDHWLDIAQPDFVLITAGWHLDALDTAHECQERAIPYAINLQVASSSHWIDERVLDRFRDSYAGARACLFLSDENRDIMQTQLAMRLENARIVENPFNVRFDADPPWPKLDSGWRLACVGRLHFEAKGQDLILRVLSAEKWRERPLRVSFWGQDHSSGRRLKSLSEMYGLQDKVELRGFCADIESLWSRHHALILPSRFEGIPMVTIEAQLCGRIVIATNCGRNGELVDDNETGFLAAAPTAVLVDEVMERAWAHREEWKSMGYLAAQRIRERYSRDPAAHFVSLLESLAEGPPPLA